MAVKNASVLAAIILVAGACGESLDGGQTCPALCPVQSLAVQDIVLNAIAFDTTLGTYPVRGTEPGLLLAERGDTLDVRAVVRWDSLPQTYLRLGVTNEITSVDSSRLFVRIDTAAANFTGTVTLEAYDVDTTAVDTNSAALIALFRADRKISSINIARSALFLQDTVSLPLDNAYLLGKIRNGQRLRVGFRMVGAGDMTIQSVETALPVALQFDPAPGDTVVPSGSLTPLSLNPRDDLVSATDLQDFSLVVKAPPAPAERVSAGGLPAYRGYLRFAIPAFYLDSVSIVRAQLELVQRPIHGLAEADLATVYPVVVSAESTVTDLNRAAQLVYAPLSFSIQPLIYAPRDSGDRRVDIVQLVRQWAAQATVTNPIQTAIVLRGANEGRAPGRLAFFGLDAPDALRPKLRISFIARTRFGTP